MGHKRRKKKIKGSTIVKVIVATLLIAAILVGAVIILKDRVKTQFAKDNSSSIKTATVESGSISTTVYGSGRLSDDDVKTQEIPDGVTLDEVKVAVGDSVKKGDVIASVDLSTVLSAMADVQSDIEDIDKKIKDASDEEIEDKITSQVAGRVKKIYAQKGDDISSVMSNNGALLLISMDGYMAVDIEAASLEAGDKVKVTTSGDKTYTGQVEKKSGNTVTILITDKGPKFEDEVTVRTNDGDEIGKGKLYIHDQLSVVGYAGTVKSVSVEENEKIKADKTLFKLKDTSYTANYEQYLSDRRDLEDDLLELTAIYRDGALLSEYEGIVKTVPDTDDSSSSSEEAVTVFEVRPDETMTVDVSIDETDILSLSVGQKADVTITSIEDETFEGVITEIDKSGESSSGVTSYTASVQIDKKEGMLAGMSATASITIKSVENALIIPLDALKQTSSTAYVYTSYDEENESFGGMTEVETGISNSSYIEITSGLSEGDTVYYKETETTSFSGRGGFGDGSGFPGGSFPGGGDFPGGNFPGGDSSSGGFPGGGSFPGGSSGKGGS